MDNFPYCSKDKDIQFGKMNILKGSNCMYNFILMCLTPGPILIQTNKNVCCVSVIY